MDNEKKLQEVEMPSEYREPKTWLDVVKGIADPADRAVIITAFARQETRADELSTALKRAKDDNASLVKEVIRLANIIGDLEFANSDLRSGSHYDWLVNYYKERTDK